MIFSSFGNVPFPFVRLAKALDEYAEKTGERVVIQTGNTEYDFKYAEGHPFFDHDTMLQYINESDVCVHQGGWGTISESIMAGKKVIAVPRIVGLEHNHPQEEVVRELEKLGCLVGCYDIEQLPALIEKVKTMEMKPLVRGNAGAIINDFLSKL